MDIAIQFEKIILDDDRFVFKPIGVIRGSYNKSADIFYSDFGTTYYLINGKKLDAEFYFSSPTTLDDLRKAFGNTSDLALLEDFLNRSKEVCYIGCYNYSENRIDITQIPFSDLKSNINKSTNNKQEIVEDIETRPYFSLEELIDLRSCNSLNIIHKRLDQLLSITQMIQNNYYEIDNQEEEKFVYELEPLTPYSILAIKEKEYSKDELLNIVAKFIYKLKKHNMPQDIFREEINIVLDAYNKIICDQQKQKKYNK